MKKKYDIITAIKCSIGSYRRKNIHETDSLSWLEITEDGVNEDGKKITSSFRIVAMRKTRKDRVIIS